MTDNQKYVLKAILYSS